MEWGKRQMWPAPSTLLSRPASWPHGSFVSPVMLWASDCFAILPLPTKCPLAGTSAKFQNQDTLSFGAQGPC